AGAVTRAAPDGYTLLYTASGIVMQNTMHSRLPYDVMRDLAPVARPVTIPFVLAVHPSVPAASVRELLSLARRSPGSLNFGASGASSQGRLGMELLKFLTGTDMVYVPYRGAALVTNALVSGEIGLALLVTPLVRPLMEMNRLRALAVTSKTRVAIMP